MKRLAGLLLALLLALPAQAQITPTYKWITLTPGGVPGTLANGQCWVQNTGSQGLWCEINGTPTGPYVTAAGASLVIGSTVVSGGANTRVLFDNAGVLGEYTAASLTAQINAFSSSLSGAAPASGGGTTNFLRADGSWAAPPAAALTVGSTTIASGTSGRVEFNNAGVLGEYTAAQLTAQINVFSSSLSGAAPSSGGGTTNFLRADGSWAVPPGTGTGTVTTTGSPANGELTQFSGASSITNGNLSGDCTTTNTLAVTCLKTNGTSFGTAAVANTGTSGGTVPLLNGTNVFSGQQSGSITTLSISTATFTPDGTNNNYKITLVHASCPCTLANPSATPVAGTSGIIQIIQSATGSDLIGTYGSSYEAPGGTASITLSTGANAVDAFAYFVVDSTHILLIPSIGFSH